MGKLQILPENLANLIAAGEVVQRPASVVKELVENAVDAGADKIAVVITDSGRTLIQVIDNGCGMSPEDARLCFERHATSKLSAPQDLHAILTYGFRGEALASIAAVSDVTLRTRREGDDLGTQVIVTAGKIAEAKETAAPQGCNFSVRNLFYNTPARRKFLKSDSVESRHILEEFQRVALTRPDVGFSLTMNGKEMYSLKPAKSLKFRVMDLMGTSVAEEIVDVEVNTSLVKVSGFVGRPQDARKTPGNQFFFVNGRYFRSAYMHKAVIKAYENFIPEGVTPSYFLYLTVDPQSVDVNIHPTKTEVKFEEESVIFQVISAAVKETLGKTSFGDVIDFDTAAADKDLPVLGKNFEQYKPASAPAPAIDFNYNPFEDKSIAPDRSFDFPESRSQGAQGYNPQAAVSQHQSYGRLFEERTVSASRVMVLHGKYILVPAKSGLMVVHARRAHFRSEDVGQAIVNAMMSIEHANPDTLAGLYSAFDDASWTDKGKLTDADLKDLIEHMSSVKKGNLDYSADIMGDAYEFLIKKFADLSKKNAGEFYTPRSIVRLMVWLLAPKPGETVYEKTLSSWSCVTKMKVIPEALWILWSSACMSFRSFASRAARGS
ncbi:MAG: DNA mismatch repair endonuclease MutL, partial [Bacteroidales bacterium]|nr:DNA mismatch repair endonuclease MutL [Bacteroidales bacterium]